VGSGLEENIFELDITYRLKAEMFWLYTVYVLQDLRPNKYF